jgi:serine/threonine protein kinase
MTEMSPAEEVFFAALEKATPAERAAYLDEACADNPALRVRVEKLLSAHPRVGGFLESAAAGDVPGKYSVGDKSTHFVAPSAVAATIIAGKYKFLEQIGEGGMGSVWMADQTEPVKRKVALKLIKAGMDSKAVLARFDAERQALALMDHPNIARVLDAGSTPDGRPFFVMELVKGVPITCFCDERQLSKC